MTTQQIGELFIPVKLDTSDLDHGLNEAKKKASSSAEAIGKAFATVGVAFTGVGVALEAFNRKQQDVSVELRKVSQDTGVTEKALRDLVVANIGAGDSFEEVTDALKSAREQGIRTAEGLNEFVGFWDTVADATGESLPALAESSVALRAMGIEAENADEAIAAFGFIASETTNSIGDFLEFLDRVGPELRDAGFNIDETAAALGILENELGMSGRTARQEFRQAIRAAQDAVRAAGVAAAQTTADGIKQAHEAAVESRKLAEQAVDDISKSVDAAAKGVEEAQEAAVNAVKEARVAAAEAAADAAKDAQQIASDVLQGSQETARAIGQAADEAGRQVEGLVKELAGLQAEMDQLRQTGLGLENDVTVLSARLAVQTDEAQDAGRKMAALNSGFGATNAESGDLSRNIGNLTQNYEGQNRAVRETEQRILALKKEMNDSSRVTEAQAMRLAQLERVLEDQQNALQGSRDELDSYSKVVAASETIDAAAAQAVIDATAAYFEELERVEEVRRAIEEQNLAVQENKKAQAELSAEINTTSQSLDQAKQKHAELETALHGAEEAVKRNELEYARLTVGVEKANAAVDLARNGNIDYAAEVVNAQKALKDAQLEHAKYSDELAIAEGNLGRAEKAEAGLKNELELATEAVEDAKTAELDMQDVKRETFKILGIGEDVFDSYNKKVAESGDVIQNYADIYANAQTPLQGLQARIGALMGQNAKLVESFGGVAAALSILGPAIGGVGLALNGIKAAGAVLNMSMLATLGPIGLVIAAIAALVVAGILIYKNWDTISAAAKVAWRAISSTVTSIVKGIAGSIGASWDFASDKTKMIWSRISDFVLSAVGGIRETVVLGLNHITSYVSRSWDFITSKTAGAWHAVPNIISGVWDSVTNTIRNAINGIIYMINMFTWAVGNIRIDIPQITIPRPDFMGGPFTIGGGSVGLPRLPQIPYMDTGGLVRGPGMFAVGAGVKEIVRTPGSAELQVTFRGGGQAEEAIFRSLVNNVRLRTGMRN